MRKRIPAVCWLARQALSLINIHPRGNLAAVQAYLLDHSLLVMKGAF